MYFLIINVNQESNELPKAFVFLYQRSQRHPRKFVSRSRANLSGVSSQKGKFAFFA